MAHIITIHATAINIDLNVALVRLCKLRPKKFPWVMALSLVGLTPTEHPELCWTHTAQVRTDSLRCLLYKLKTLAFYQMSSAKSKKSLHKISSSLKADPVPKNFPYSFLISKPYLNHIHLANLSVTC